MTPELLLAASLFVMMCINNAGGELCHEFEIRSFPTVAACDEASKGPIIVEWYNSVAFTKARVRGYRCGPRGTVDDDI